MKREKRKLIWSGTKVVGTLEAGWLVKRVDPAEHKLQDPSGWATDYAHLYGILPPILGVRLFTTTGQVWEASRKMFVCYGVIIERGEDLGAQVCLPDRYWTIVQVDVLGRPTTRQLAMKL